MANNIETIEAKININAELAKKSITDLINKLNIFKNSFSAKKANAESDILGIKQKIAENKALILSLNSYRDKYIKAAKNDVSPKTTMKELMFDQGYIEEVVNPISEATRKSIELKELLKLAKEKLNNMKSPLELIKEKISKVGKSIVKIAGRMLIRKALNAILNKIKDVQDYFAKVDNESGGKYGFNKTLSDSATNLTKLAAILSSVGTFLKGIIQPVLNAITNIIVKLYNWVAKLINKIANNKLMILDTDYWQNYADSVANANKSTKQLLSGFDELNMLNKKEDNALDGLIDEEATKQSVEAFKEVEEETKTIAENIQSAFEQVKEGVEYSKLKTEEDKKSGLIAPISTLFDRSLTTEQKKEILSSSKNMAGLTSFVGITEGLVKATDWLDEKLGNIFGRTEDNRLIVNIDGNVIYTTQQDYANKYHNISGR